MDYTFEDSLRSIGNLDNLMVWLLVHNSENQALQHSFLLSYRTMLSIDDVIECLSRISDNGRLPGKYCKNFLFTWVNGYYAMDWKKKLIVPRMLEFSRTVMDADDFNLLKNMCVKDIGARRNKHVHSIPNTKTEHKTPRNIIGMLSPSRPRSTSTDLVREWGGVSTHILATQMTVMEQELFCDVQPIEFLKDCWQSPHREVLSPRLFALVKRFNDVSFWVATQVVTCPSVKHQTMVIRKFIKIAYKLYKFHNYNSLMQILSGLHNVSVSRLRSAWAGLPGNALDKFKKIDDFMSANNNFQQYRDTLNDLLQHKTAALPYLVLFMRDITFIEENSERTAEGNMNFLKLLRLGRQLHWFVHFTKTDYGFHMDFQIQKMLMELKFLSESELYQVSCLCEPRQGNTIGHSSQIAARVSEMTGDQVRIAVRSKRATWRKSSKACWGVKAN